MSVIPGSAELTVKKSMTERQSSEMSVELEIKCSNQVQSFSSPYPYFVSRGSKSSIWNKQKHQSSSSYT